MLSTNKIISVLDLKIINVIFDLLNVSLMGFLTNFPSLVGRKDGLNFFKAAAAKTWSSLVSLLRWKNSTSDYFSTSNLPMDGLLFGLNLELSVET